MQYNDEGILHLFAFYLKKFNRIVINYKVHDKLLLAVVDPIKNLRK
jgi:hypothetical protein